MKKKILLGIVVTVVLFTITGCSKEKNNVINANNTNDDKNVVIIQGEKYKLKSEQTLKNIHYKENYVDFHSDAIGNIRTMSYVKQNTVVFNVRVMYDENRSLSELKAILETQTGAKEQNKEVNEIKYIYYEYKTDDNLMVHHYIYVYDGIVYFVEFFLGDNPGNIEEVFMNNVSFG